MRETLYRGNTMDNLNKENFWNEMYSKYPKAMQNFCNWIDEYKKRNNWENLFNDTYRKGKVSRASNGEISNIEFHSPKFHDLPLAMQMGIFGDYINEFELSKCKEHIDMIMYGMEEGLNESAASTTTLNY